MFRYAFVINPLKPAVTIWVQL